MRLSCASVYFHARVACGAARSRRLMYAHLEASTAAAVFVARACMHACVYIKRGWEVVPNVGVGVVRAGV